MQILRLAIMHNVPSGGKLWIYSDQYDGTDLIYEKQFSSIDQNSNLNLLLDLNAISLNDDLESLYITVASDIEDINALNNKFLLHHEGILELIKADEKTLEIVGLTTDIKGACKLGQSIELAALATEGRNVQYEFWVKPPNEAWKVIRDYSELSSCEFTPQKTGLYELGVRVIDDNNQLFKDKTIYYTVEDGIDLDFLLEASNIGAGDKLKREHMLAIISELYGVQNEAQTFSIPADFNDVSSDDWFAPYVWYGFYQGWTAGMGDGSFGVGENVDARMLSTFVLKSMGYTVPDYYNSVDQLRSIGVVASFEDERQITFGETVAVIRDTVGVSLDLPMSIISLEASTTNGIYIDNPMIITANVRNGINEQYEFWVKAPQEGWQVAQNYSKSNQFIYTPETVGTYEFGVRVIDDNNPDFMVSIVEYEIDKKINLNFLVDISKIKLSDYLKREHLLAVVAELNDVEEEAKTFGIPADFSDVSSNDWFASYVWYGFYQGWTAGMGDGSFGVGRNVDAKTLSTFVIKSMGYEVSNYDASVEQLRSIGISAEFADENNVTFAETIQVIDDAIGVANLKLPMSVQDLVAITENTSTTENKVVLTAHVNNGANVKYQFWARRQGQEWSIVQSYSPENHYIYQATESGTYQFGVWVVDDNNPVEQIRIIDYVVREPLKLNKLNTNTSGNTSEIDTAINLSSEITGGSNVQYQYWVMTPGCPWEIAQSYSSAETFTYTPKVAGAYQFGVWVIDDNNQTHQVDVIEYNVTGSAPEPVKLNRLQTNQSGNTSRKDTAITLSSDITGGSNTLCQFWVKRPGYAWEIVQSYCAKDTFIYTPELAGNYQFGIWVIDDNNKNHQIDIIDYTVTESEVIPVKLNKLNTDQVGNISSKNMAVTLNPDVTGGSNAQYQFWVKKPGCGWEVVQSYSSVDSYTYVPSSAGNYQFGIWVTDDNNKNQQIDIIDFTVTESSKTPVKLNKLSTNKSGNTSALNTPITLSADITGGTNVQYQFWVKRPGLGWVVAKTYSSADNYIYTPSSTGNYQFGIWVIDDNNKNQQIEIIDYTVTSEEVQSVTLNSLDTNTGNTSEEDVAVTLNADVTGGSNVQYQFWVKRPGRGWEIAQSYSSTDHYTYTPRSAGAYEFGLWVIDDNNKVQQIEIISHTVEVKATSPVKLNGLATNNVSNSSDVELPIKLMADISGGSNVEYRFWVMKPGQGWEIVKDYSSEDIYTYTPSQAGTYQFGIWVIDDSTTTHQVDIISYTVTEQSGDLLVEEPKISADELKTEDLEEEVEEEIPVEEEMPATEGPQEEVDEGAQEEEETPTTEGSQEEANEGVLEEVLMEEETSVAEGPQEEVNEEAPVEELSPTTEDSKEVIEEDDPVEEEPSAAEEAQEKVIVEEPVVEETLATEEITEEAVEEEPLLEETPAAEETQEEVIAEEPVVEETPAAEEFQEEAVEEEPVVEETPVTEEPQKEVTEDEPVEEETSVTEESQEDVVD